MAGELTSAKPMIDECRKTYKEHHSSVWQLHHPWVLFCETIVHATMYVYVKLDIGNRSESYKPGGGMR